MGICATALEFFQPLFGSTSNQPQAETIEKVVEPPRQAIFSRRVSARRVTTTMVLGEHRADINFTAVLGETEREFCGVLCTYTICGIYGSSDFYLFNKSQEVMDQYAILSMLEFVRKKAAEINPHLKWYSLGPENRFELASNVVALYNGLIGGEVQKRQIC